MRPLLVVVAFHLLNAALRFSGTTATKQSIMYVPLDERFATRGLFLNLARLTDYNVVTPPVSMLPKRKAFANPDAMLDWMEANAHRVSAGVISAEMVMYGGLIASRSSNDTELTVRSRLERLRKMGESFDIHLSTVVMRIPSYNGDFEEPWYWEQFGRELYEYSFHKGRYDSLHDQQDKTAFENISSQIPQNVLRKFLWRRQRNLHITEELFKNMAVSTTLTRPAFASVYCTLDDSGVYGINVEEANALRNLSSTLQLGSNVKIYPGADEVGASLLAKLVATKSSGRARHHPTVKILWRVPNATSLIPNYESQTIEDTVKNQLSAAGFDLFETASSKQDSQTPDVLFVVNNFGVSPQLESSQQPASSPLSDYEDMFTTCRKYASSGSIIAFADVRYSNGGDNAFVKYLLNKVNTPTSLNELDAGDTFLSPGKFAYAGWNTDANTLGTTASNAVLLWAFQNPTALEESKRFTLLRFTEDVLYQSRARSSLISKVQANGGDINNLVPHLGAYEAFVFDQLNQKSLAEILDLDFPVLQSVYFPWNRTFEIGLRTTDTKMMVQATKQEETDDESMADSELDLAASADVDCDILVVGGSTAALATALSAADDNSSSTVCLTEPTDWLGGQLTSSLISAIDFGHSNRRAECLPKNFVDMLSPLGFPNSNPGQCWVSTFCYEANDLLEKWILPQVAKRAPNLKVFYQTVPTAVHVENSTISTVDFVRRELKPFASEGTFSEEVEDWYSPKDSATYRKTLMSINSQVVVDATEFGDILVLSRADFVQGNELSESTTDSRDTCGQAIVFPFYMGAKGSDTDAAKATISSSASTSDPPFSLDGHPWDTVWSYRRVKGGQASSSQSLMAWGSEKGDGNDYPLGYHFLSVKDTVAQRDSGAWLGGLDIASMRAAEQTSLEFSKWYVSQEPSSASPKNPVILTGKKASGTKSGLSKMPYIRDTRRSIGVDGFRLKSSDLSSGNVWADTVGIGDYLYFDTHSTQGCPTLQFSGKLQPYTLPLRALTNDAIANLVVAGKTMAQTNAANAATRLHPVEWVSGTAAGIFASALRSRHATTEDLVQECSSSTSHCALQEKISSISPLDWSCLS